MTELDPTRRHKRRSYDAKRRAEPNIRGLYKTKRWLEIRKRTLAGGCRDCKENRGEIRPATHCDHVTPHRGDVAKFWAGPFRGLCSTCHDQHKQREELEGFSRQIGVDGWPIDDRHPFSEKSK